MSFQPFDYASKQRIETTEAVTKELFVVEAGVAIFNFRGDGGEWLRDQLDIPTDTVMMRPSVGGGPGSLVTFHGPRVVATASLASISNNNEAINAGWAVDACWWDQDASGRIVLHVNLAVRDGDGFLDRIAYHMTAIGFPVFEVGIHHGS